MNNLESLLCERHARIVADVGFNAWIHIAELEDLLALAGGVDPALPLYGKTFAVKDNIDVAGMSTTAACPSFAYTPDDSSPVVQALLDAGAICMGKTHMDQFATGLVGTRSPHGSCRNAFCDDMISGGSSSGSAVAVALGHVDFALGTDTAGSGRVPATFQRLIGVKPTRGLLSTRGVVPACASLDCVSIFTPDTGLAETILDLVAHPDPGDPWSRSAPMTPSHAGPWRIGVADPDTLFFDGDISARDAYAGAIAQWKTLGHEMVTIDIRPFLEAAQLLYGGPWVAERYAAVGEFLEKGWDDLDPTVCKIILGGKNHGAVETFRALEKLQGIRAEVAPLWDGMDMLMLPTVPTCYSLEAVRADPIGLNSNLGTYTNFMNLLDLAAIAVPHGSFASGVPCGVTLMAPAFGDAFLLRAARVFHEDGKAEARGMVRLAVLGAHLRGLPLHHQLEDANARFVREVRTAPRYRFYALPNSTPPKPGIVRVSEGGGSIWVETYDLTPEAFGRFVAKIPHPLGIGTLELEDGEWVKGFICEPAGIEGATDITDLGGWRAFLAEFLRK
ncbi:MAG: allophanate hydrolase [Verrucomicrobia bacterium]|nr:allophanate hydrolase [Verrucomicrobiota bacterium]MCH8514208.1 allophanate hydrolase [Kiritimatiellia bacterium]